MATHGVLYEDGVYGKRAVLSVVGPDTTEELCRAGVVELEINSGRGWRGTNLGSVPAVPGLQALEIRGVRLLDPDSLYANPDLLSLRLFIAGVRRLALERFPKLRDLSLYWTTQTSGLADLTDLQTLVLEKFTAPDLRAVSRLERLESLQVLGGDVASLTGIEPLSALRKLRLARLKTLHDLQPLAGLRSLTSLTISGCKNVSDVSALSSLHGLTTLNLLDMGMIDSFRPLRTLDQLRTLNFSESTNVADGDLSVIAERGLTASFRNRRHYSETREGLQKGGMTHAHR